MGVLQLSLQSSVGFAGSESEDAFRNFLLCVGCSLQSPPSRIPTLLVRGCAKVCVCVYRNVNADVRLLGFHGLQQAGFCNRSKRDNFSILGPRVSPHGV